MRCEKGSVLIVVLWTLALVAVLAGVLASEARLAGRTVLHHKEMLKVWADSLSAVNMAKMELMLARMPQPLDKKQTSADKRKKDAYRFDGRDIKLAYSIPESIGVRIYDHAGKINLRRINVRQLRLLLEKQLGVNIQQIDALIDAWRDWLDNDDLKRLNGAEKNYYEKLDSPYNPRNGPLETVEEMLLIKGFAEVFQDVDLQAAFTLYGTQARVNPNLATRQTLALLPGVDSEVLDKILAQRSAQDFKSVTDFNQIMSPEQLKKFAEWIYFSTSNYFTIAVYPKSYEKEKLPNNEQESENVPQLWAYSEIVQGRGYGAPPQTLQVRPLGRLSEDVYVPQPAGKKQKYLSHF